MKYVIRTATGEFLYGGPYEPACDPATQSVVEVDRHPARRTERWGGSAIRPATAQEIADADAGVAGAAIDHDKALRAVVIYFTKRLNEVRQNPSTTLPALTAAAVRQGLIDEYKAL